MTTTTGPASGIPPIDSDVAQLHSLGYAQELRRRMGAFSNFAVSFTIISVLSGCLTLYYFGMTYGGPVDIVWGWIIVGVMTTIVGLGMAEIASAYPTAGGLYYWSAKLSKNNPGAWSWFTGWFNLLGQVAVTAGIDYGFATFFSVFLNLTTGFHNTVGWVLVVYAGILFVHGVLNTFGVRIIAFLSDVSAWWHVLGVVTIAIVLFFVPSHHASLSFMFTKFTNQSTLGVPWFVFMVGLLMAQYTFTGYDASAHMSEETHNADLAAPRGIVTSIVVSLIAGWVLILAITSVIPSDPKTYAAIAPQLTAPVAIWQNALSRLGVELLLVIVVIAQAFCGMASVAANSRMLFAFSRDGAVPGHKYWHRINPRTRTPTNSIWFCVVFAFLLAVPSLWSSVAYGAVTSIATIGLYIAYVLPTLLRRLQGKAWQGGRWSLGRWSPLVGWVGIIWVGFIAVLFMLPEVGFSTINRDNFNYAPVAVGVVLLFSGSYWLLSARKWFKGPKTQGDEAALERIEAEFDNIERELEEVD
ncbi:MAG TPA: amino acid permease [Acidimicrobiales bacterium]|nr:amino acid permease [Acidimicrobiales bacterium]